MGKGYIYHEDGTVEVEDYSVDGSQTQLWCSHCQEFTWHQFTAMSSTRGMLYTCLKCGREEPK